jgi:preprotein translocase subunit SecG
LTNKTYLKTPPNPSTGSGKSGKVFNGEFFMLYGLLLSLFVFICFLLIFIILLQKSKSSMGLGGLGGGTQMLFGGSGGQDLFQKITWVLVAIFMSGSLMLTLMKSSSSHSFQYGYKPTAQPVIPAQAPVQTAPVLPQASTEPAAPAGTSN